MIMGCNWDRQLHLVRDKVCASVVTAKFEDVVLLETVDLMMLGTQSADMVTPHAKAQCWQTPELIG